ncbi:MAG: hypothetical protein IPI10_06270 [Bacteroidetes bacterium]|nr:hypothetical protein [Bacteroidota bacterium]
MKKESVLWHSIRKKAIILAETSIFILKKICFQFCGHCEGQLLKAGNPKLLPNDFRICVLQSCDRIGEMMESTIIDAILLAQLFGDLFIVK